MKTVLLTIAFIAMSILSFAQQNYQDVVYLKNGSVIRGVIIEQMPNKYIKIQTSDKSIFVYQFEEIEKITKEEIKGQKGNSNSNEFTPGYRGIEELGYVLGSDDYSPYLKLNIINGYSPNPHFSIGIGTGLRYYYQGDEFLLPVFLDCRIKFTKNNVTPYISFDLGYSFYISDDFEAVGAIINPAVGIEIKTSGKSSINIGVGYEMQGFEDYSYYNGYHKEFAKNFSLNLGVSY